VKSEYQEQEIDKRFKKISYSEEDKRFSEILYSVMLAYIIHFLRAEVDHKAAEDYDK
jgi:hypothetical protein